MHKAIIVFKKITLFRLYCFMRHNVKNFFIHFKQSKNYLTSVSKLPLLDGQKKYNLICFLILIFIWWFYMQKSWYIKKWSTNTKNRPSFYISPVGTNTETYKRTFLNTKIDGHTEIPLFAHHRIGGPLHGTAEVLISWLRNLYKTKKCPMLSEQSTVISEA